MPSNHPNDKPLCSLPEISIKGWPGYKKKALADKAGTFHKAERFVDEIQLLYEEWDDYEEYNISDAWYEWIEELVPIEVLEFLRKKGCFTPEEEQRFADIVARFKAHKPQIETMKV